ncbi:MAG: SDR family oxidoreductase [Burkholderiales bacterium]|nr:SDR family oxidoreductase [Burkholderiales bacterium]
MKILILGGDGMLGHELLLRLRARHEVRVTLRRRLEDYARFELFDASNADGGVDVRDFGCVERCVETFRPDAIVNAVGVVKQRPTATESIPSIEINALLPHRLLALCRGHGMRLVHMSTDCVFSGKAGNYREEDFPDADDLYGRSKLLGEVHEAPGITLRTSIIGRELSRKTGLLEWFLAQRGKIRGYRKAIFSGFTTAEMARIIDMVLTRFPQTHGLYHVSGAPISKYDLLRLIRDRMRLATEIEPDDDFRCDRSLDSARFRREFDYVPPAWEAMVEELART